MKKRFLAAVLALTMTAACLTACGGENKTEDKQETTTTATTSEKTTTTTSMPNGKAEYKITTTKVTTTKGEERRPSDIPQDVNPGQWHEDSETTTTTTTKAKTTTTKPKTTTTKAKTTTTKATTTKAKVSTTNGYWHEDPGITKADLKAAAEAAFAKVKKTAIEYGWKIAETLVNRNTDTQYGIYCKVEISAAASANGQYDFILFTIKSEVVNNGIRTTFGQIPLGGPVGSKNYDDYSYCSDISYLIEGLKER